MKFVVADLRMIVGVKSTDVKPGLAGVRSHDTLTCEYIEDKTSNVIINMIRIC